MERNKSLERNTFPAKLMSIVLEKRMSENVAISPMGISYVLKALQIGMNPNCACFKKIEELIGSIMSKYENLDYSRRHVLRHALSCWYNSKYGALKNEYVKELIGIDNVSIFETDFEKDEKLVDKMNTWGKKNSHGLIKNLGKNVDANDIMLLIDTLCLYAEWYRKFDEELTKRDTFYNANGGKSHVNMMHRLLDCFRYCETGEYQTITLRYEGCYEVMKIVKPKGNTSLYELMTKKLDTWTQSNDNLANVDFYMPRFNIESDCDIINLFENMGLTEMLQDTSIFDNMADTPIKLNKLQGRCIIDVNEKGTRIASLIESSMKLGKGLEVKTYEMKLDRPFGFAIMGIGKNMERSEVPLFAGVVNILPDSTSNEIKIIKNNRNNKKNNNVRQYHWRHCR